MRCTASWARYRADPRSEKIDLGVGVYRDETGASPVMQAVRDAERIRIERQDSKAYQALAGDHDFIAAMTDLVFGPDHPAVRDGRIAAIQGTGGTGSLRIAFELARLAQPQTAPAARFAHLAQSSRPRRRHGTPVVPHRYFDVAEGRIDLAAIEAAARGSGEGDLFLLHGPCHNPDGADLTAAQRAALHAILAERGAVPLIDAAYYGLGDGLAADLQLLRDAAGASPRALISVACSKASAFIASAPASCSRSAGARPSAIASRARWSGSAARSSPCPPPTAPPRWRWC
jgi:aromatic-amino-acid transaminase